MSSLIAHLNDPTTRSGSFLIARRAAPAGPRRLRVVGLLALLFLLPTKIADAQEAGSGEQSGSTITQRSSALRDGRRSSASSSSQGVPAETPSNVPVDLREATLNKAMQHVLQGPGEWTSPNGLVSTLKIMLLLTVLSVAPAILLMTTSFIRVLVVLGLLRQAIGTQQLPPTQVITSLALFITLLVMTPVWSDVYNDAIVPYRDNQIGWEEAWNRGKAPIVGFMGHQIESARNTDDIWMLYDYYAESSGKASEDAPDEYAQMPLQVLIPAYVLSELKTAFLIGFQIYLPFLVLDIVIASVTISMGMLMLPPVMISLPFKIMIFVLVDGWHLVVSMLLESFGAFW